MLKLIKLKKNMELPLPSKIKIERYKVIKRFQKDAEKNLNIFKDTLVNIANFKTKKGMNKASPKSKNPRDDTKRQIENYNILGIYINNISKLENYAKKKNRTRYFTFQQPSSTS